MKTIIIMLGLVGIMNYNVPAQVTTMSTTPLNQVNSGNGLNNPNLNQGANYNNNNNNSNYNHSPNYSQNQIGNPYEQNNNTLNTRLAPVNNINNNNTMTPFNNTTSPYDFTSPYYTPPASAAPLNGVPPVK